MRVTDYDLVELETIRIEIENRDWTEVETRTFLLWLIDEKGWFLDLDHLLISIPDEELIYKESLGVYICLSANVKTYAWQTLHRKFSGRLQNWFQAYINEHYDASAFQVDDYDEIEEIDRALAERRLR